MEHTTEITVTPFKESDKALTQGQVDEYVRNGITCPFCGETDLDPSNCDMNDGSVTQFITCNSCDESWEDIYFLAGIYHNNKNQYKTGEDMDARLIAAAPDLLAMLNLAVRYLEHPDVMAVTQAMALPGAVAVDRIKAAIVKAEKG